MELQSIPEVFRRLIPEGCIEEKDLKKTQDGFWVADLSVADILARKQIFDYPDEDGLRIPCCRFFDDWFIYAIAYETDHIYGLLKLREQEHDAEEGIPADGDTPGVTISFIAFDWQILLACLADPSAVHVLQKLRKADAAAGYH